MELFEVIMNLVEKFSVEVSTSRVSSKPLKPEILDFNDGSLRVSLPGIDSVIRPREFQSFTISAFIGSMDDLMVAAQIKEIINRKSETSKVFINILGTPYTRYDRVMFPDGSDSFGLWCFSNAVDALNFDEVRIFDPHSRVTQSLIKNCFPIKQDILVDITVGDISSFDIVCPDKGASMKLDDQLVKVLCDKDRDPVTGKIRGIKVVFNKSEGTKPLLVVDDICEGGGTFLGLAESFKDNVHLEGRELNLYVTHGIFSKNALPKLLEKYSHIYVYCMKCSVYNTLTESQKLNVSVNTLVSD